MKVRINLLTAALFCVASCFAMAEPGRSQDRPNIIFILADDLGWTDVAYSGSRLYQTPNIDALSRQGMVFTQAYAANPLCSPTRASILTGLHPARIGITFPDCHYEEEILEKGLDPKPDSSQKWIGAQSVTRLKTQYITLPEVLKPAGYATGHFGKWHLGRKPYHPLNQGFDEDFPQWSWAPGPGKYIGPWRWGVNGTDDNGADGAHIEDRTTDEAVKFIRKNRDKPFFLNYWAWSVHGPHETKKELLDKYGSLADPAAAQKHPYYAGMIETLDDNVGKLLKAVREAGLEKNTIIVFFSDNGGIHWPSRQALPGVPVTSNSPLRGGKATIYEGGTRVPCIVYWPGMTQAGSASDQLISSIDWYPTLLEMAGARPDPEQTPDGISIVPAIKGKPLGRNTLYCHFPQGDGVFTNGHQPSTYVRQGDWKLIRFYCDNADRTDRFELYNLKTDIGETQNLAARHPDRVRNLKGLMDAFLADTEAVIPVPNPSYQERKTPEIVPSMATWRMDTNTINLTARHSPFNVLVNLRSLGRDRDIMEDKNRDRIRDIAAHAERKGISLVADLDPRMALPAFEARYPDELQQMIVLKEIRAGAPADTGSVTIRSRALRDHYHQPYQTRSGAFVRALGYRLTVDGLIDPASLKDISEDCRVLSATKESVQVRLPAVKNGTFTNMLLMVSFSYLYPDVFAPHLMEFQSEIFRKYAGLPLGGAHNDEWGFPAALSEESLQHECWYSPHMAEAYARYTGDNSNLLDDIVLMHKGIRGLEKDRLRRINLFGEFIRDRNGALEAHFYNKVKETFGPQSIVGVHSTWFPFPERREFRKNGLNWWVSKRDLAQTDEVVPFAIRTSLAKKWKSPVWYNMFYRYGLPEGESNAEDYVQEVWSSALAGGRVNNLPSVVEVKGILGSDFVKAETRVRLLNYIQPTALNCPIAIIFGHAAAMNRLGTAFEDVGTGLADSLWRSGIATDLIPSSEIHNGSLKVDGEGYIRYGDQRYSAVILYNPEFEKEETAGFFSKAATGKTRLYRIGSWTTDFNGNAFSGDQALPMHMKPATDKTALVSEIRQILEENNIPLQTPASRRIEGFGHVSYGMPATGFSYLLDGTLIQVAGTKNAAGDPIRSTMKIGDHEVTFDAVGVAAIRLDNAGNPEAIAAAGLKSLKTGGFSLTLPERVDLALKKNGSGQWKGVIQAEDGRVPAALQAITQNWTHLLLPEPYPQAPKKEIRKVFIPPVSKTAETRSARKERVTDIDGHEYSVVKLGEQTWMGENLRSVRLNDGTAIPGASDNFWQTKDTANQPNFEAIYGRLYQGHVVQSDKLCPSGWRIPNDTDWEQLIDFLDNSADIREKTAFNPRAAGYLHAYGAHINPGKSGIWWSASDNRRRMVWNEGSRQLYLAEGRGLALSYGFSVRCIKK